MPPGEFRTLIDSTTLAAHLDDADWVILDCRFDLTDPSKGEREYEEGHIPGARYMHLDRDLSGPKTGTNGRHPLPSPEAIRERFSALGIAPDLQVIAYDADSGMYASRLWWMLRWMGHEGVAVLNGGLARWRHEGRPVRSGREHWTPATFVGEPREEWRLTVDEVLSRLDDPATFLVDSRSNERYRGIGETLDPVAGHIPGAANYFFQQNLTPDKSFRSPEELRAQWTPVLKDHDPKEVVVYCGSGVSACHNLLALEHAGISGVRLFPGSWSEWCADPDRPIET